MIVETKQKKKGSDESECFSVHSKTNNCPVVSDDDCLDEKQQKQSEQDNVKRRT